MKEGKEGRERNHFQNLETIRNHPPTPPIQRKPHPNPPSKPTQIRANPYQSPKSEDPSQNTAQQRKLSSKPPNQMKPPTTPKSKEHTCIHPIKGSAPNRGREAPPKWRRMGCDRAPQHMNCSQNFKFFSHPCFRVP